MKDAIINNSLNLVRKEHPEYTDEKIEEIEYGLVSLYLTITKTIIIVLLALALGILKELIIFLLIYNIIKSPSFGIHATSSIKCLIYSSVAFLSLSYICINLEISINIKIILGIIGIIFMFKNSPADTEKRPIINPKRRKGYKIISTILAIVFVVLSVVITNNFVANCFLITLLLQCVIIAPTTYKLFNQPFDNYKNYI